MRLGERAARRRSGAVSAPRLTGSRRCRESARPPWNGCSPSRFSTRGRSRPGWLASAKKVATLSPTRQTGTAGWLPSRTCSAVLQRVPSLPCSPRSPPRSARSGPERSRVPLTRRSRPPWTGPSARWGAPIPVQPIRAPVSRRRPIVRRRHQIRQQAAPNRRQPTTVRGRSRRSTSRGSARWSRTFSSCRRHCGTFSACGW